MKKFAFLLIFFIFLGGLVWGETYTWTGLSANDGTDWNDRANWEDGVGTPAAYYPGENIADTAVIGGASSVVVTAPLAHALASLEISGESQINTGSETLTAVDFTLNSKLTLVGNLEITNLEAGPGGEIAGDDIVFTGGGTIAVLSTTHLTIEDADGTLGAINAGARDVFIETDNTNSSVTLGAITVTAGKNITLALDGNRNFNGSGNNFNNVTVKSGAVITLAGDDLECSVLANNGTIHLGSQNITAVTINNSGTLNLGARSITSAVNNNGTIRLTGAASQTVSSVTAANGTIEFYDNESGFAGLNTFHNLVISAGTRLAAQDLIVNGALSITGGSLSMNNQNLNITGNITGAVSNIGELNLAVSSPNTQTIDFGATTVASLNKSSTGIAVITDVFTVSGNTVISGGEFTVNGDLNLNGIDLHSAAIIKVNGGSWTNDAATGNFINGKVIFEDATVNGDNIFHDVTCIGQVRFEHNQTQTISGILDATGATLLTSTTPDYWNLTTPLTNPPHQNIKTHISTVISWCNSNRELSLSVTEATDGEDNKNVFYYSQYEWTGSNSALWNNKDNWSPRIVPPDTAHIIIPPAANNPVVNVLEVKCNILTIGSGGELDIGQNELVITDTSLHNAALNNSGTIKLHGTTGQVTINGGVPYTAGIAVNGTIHYYGMVAGGNEWVFGYLYTNLHVADTAEMKDVTQSLIVSDDAEIGSDITANVNQTYKNLELKETVTLEGAHITIHGAINGGGFDLNIDGKTAGNANAVFNGGSNIGALAVDGKAQFNTALLEADSVTVSGDAEIYASVSASGIQTYSGNVTLGGSSSQITLTGTTVTLGEITGGTKDLTITGDAVLNGADNLGDLLVEGDAEFNAAVTNAASVKIDGNAVINANITTAGIQSYNTVDLDNHNITLESSGDSIAATGIISGTGNLIVNASSGINLNAHNAISGNIALNNNTSGVIIYNSDLGTGNNLTITATNDAATGGNITIAESTGDIIIPAGGTPSIRTNTPLGEVTITAAGSVTASGNIGMNSRGDVKLKSGAAAPLGGIQINGAIDCYRLTMDAGGIGIVNIGTGAAVAVSSINDSDHYDGELDPHDNAAIYILAHTFSGAGSMTLEGANPAFGWVCVMVYDTTTYSGIVTPNNIHYHPHPSNHIVYRNGPNPGSLVAGTYTYFQADSDQWDDKISFATSGDRNIYIMNIEENSAFYANTRDVNFYTIDGAIEIHGNYYSSGELNLKAGTDGIKLKDANIVLTNEPVNNPQNSFMTNGTEITLIGTSESKITTGANIEVNNISTVSVSQNLTLTASNITLNGDADINGDLTIINSDEFTLKAGTLIKLDGSFKQTSGGVNSSSSLAGGISVHGTDSTSAVSSITFNDVVTIDGIASLKSDDGKINFYSEIIGAASGGVLNGDLTLNSNSANHASTTGVIEITNKVGYNNGPAYLKSLHVEGGILHIYDNIYAKDMIFDADLITLGNDVTIAAPPTGGSIKINKNIDENKLTLSGGTYYPEDTSQAFIFSQEDNNSYFKDVKIAADSYIKVQGTLGLVKGYTLTIEAGSGNSEPTTLDITDMDLMDDKWQAEWLILEGDDIDKKKSSRVIIANDTGWFLETNEYDTTGWAYIQSIRGDVEINPTSSNAGNPKLILEMHIDKQNPNVIRKIKTDVPLGSLHIYCRTELQNDLIINGEFKIGNRGEEDGVLDASDFDITVLAGLTGKRNTSNFTHNGNNEIKYARWEIETDSPLEGDKLPADMEKPPFGSKVGFPFYQKPGGKVIFGAPDRENSFFEIDGNTMWRNFVCEEPGAVIQFSMHPDHHIFLDEVIINSINDSKPVTLTRYLPSDKNNWVYVFDSNSPYIPPAQGVTPTPVPGLPSYPASKNLKNDKNENIKFWNFNLITPPDQDKDYKQLKLYNVQVYFSHAWYQRIPLPINDPHLSIYPYYRASPKKGCFNFEWGLQFNTVIYSFVEDSDGNGKVDRIRVQSNVALNNNFNEFTAIVEKGEYEVLDYKMVSNVLKADPNYNNDPDDEMEFYIFLKEQASIYDGKPLSWVIEFNESLYDNITGDICIGKIDGSTDLPPYKTINTIPPRVSYALTLPGYNQTFFRFSQPVDIEIGGEVGGNIVGSHLAFESSEAYEEVLEYLDSEASVIPYTYTVKEGALGYLYEINQSPSVEELAKLPSNGDDVNLPEIYFTAKGFKGISVRALDWNDDRVDPELYLYYPSPRYPADWNYSSYKKYVGNGHLVKQGNVLSGDDENNPDIETEIFLPPYKALSPGMIRMLQNKESVVPSDFINQDLNSNDLRRRSTDVLVSIDMSSESNYFARPVWARHPNSDETTEKNTTIWDFNGSKYLEARGNIDLQASMNDSFSGTLDLFWTNNIGIEFRSRQEDSTRGKNTGGLWQPDLAKWLGEDDPLYSVSPRLASSEQVSKLSESAAGSSNLFNYTFINNENLKSGQKFEFIFRIKDGLIEKEGVHKGQEINPDMFIACLDIPNGAVIPGDWYKRIRPFSFDIQDPRLQRGGVTIMNNVINSDKKEQTYLRYHLVRPGRVTIQVYTLDGSLVKSIRRNEQRAAGEWVDTWDGTNNGGRSVARGMYFIRVVGPDIDEIRKVMVVK